MSVRNAFVLLLTLSTLLFLASCGSSSNTATPPPSGAFSASDLNGTYVFSFSGTDAANSTFFAMAGTFTANGSGGITSGSVDIIDPAYGFCPDIEFARTHHSLRFQRNGQRHP